MTKVTLQLDVDDEVAKRLAGAAPDDRAAAELLAVLSLEDWANRPKRALKRIMDHIGAEATRRGLTDQELEAILNED